MAKFLRLLKDDLRRFHYSEKLRRNNKLKSYLGITAYKEQIRRFKNYCQLTGAARSYYSQFALSRHCLRKYSSFGMLPGVMKSSW